MTDANTTERSAVALAHATDEHKKPTKQASPAVKQPEMGCRPDKDVDKDSGLQPSLEVIMDSMAKLSTNPGSPSDPAHPAASPIKPSPEPAKAKTKGKRDDDKPKGIHNDAPGSTKTSRASSQKHYTGPRPLPHGDPDRILITALEKSLLAHLLAPEDSYYYLTEQYRMVPQLADLLHACGIYDDTVTNGSGTDIESRPLALKFQEFLHNHHGLERKSLMVINHTGASSLLQGDSRVNPAFAERVWNIIGKLLANRFKGSDIAIIASNHGQKRLHYAMQLKLAQTVKEAQDIDILIFRECGGFEASVVIIDLVVCESDKADTKQVREDVGAALSRARDGMIIIGDGNIAKDYTGKEPYRDLFKHAEKTGCLVTE